MPSVLRVSLLCFAAWAATGCTTMRPVESPELAATVAALEPGDRVSVLTPTGWHDDVNVVALTDSAIELKTLRDERVNVSRAEVWELRVPAPSRGKRAGLIAGIAAAVVVGLHLAAGYEFDY